MVFSTQGPVAQKLVKDNPGFIVSQDFYYSLQKEFSKLILTGHLIESKAKT